MPTLNSPITIKNLTLQSRLVMPPMVTNLCTAEGEVTYALLRHYGKRAGSGLGMIIVEASAIAAEGKIISRQPGIWDDSFVVGLSRLATTIKEGGAVAAIQIVHGGARVHGENIPLYGASNIRLRKGNPPEITSKDQIKKIIADFGSAALRAKEAGFDAVEIHGAHYYLISQFLSPYSNQRQDEYGGSPENRRRLALEIIRHVRERVGSDYPLIFRINGIEMFEGGMTTEEAVEAAQAAVEAGIDILDVSGIGRAIPIKDDTYTYIMLSSNPPKDGKPAPYLEAAKRIRQATGKPVIAVGKLNDPQSARMAVEGEYCDMVAIGKNLLADSEIAQKILQGLDEKILLCEECLTCLATIGKQEPVRCKLNPDLGN